MRRTTAAGLFAVLVTLAGVIGIIPTASPAAAAMPDIASAEAQFLSLLNSARAANGKAPMTRDGGLDGVARAWSNHMAAVYAVTGDPVIKPNGPNNCDLSSLCHRPDLVVQVSGVEPSWQLIGENIGVGGSVTSLHDSLMSSSGHRQNILGTYNRVGVGVNVTGDKIWVTFDFLLGPPISGSTGNDQAVPVPVPPLDPVVALASRTRYNPVSPVRVLDTRTGIGGYAGYLQAGAVLRLRLAGTPYVPAGSGGVALNLTATGPTAAGWLTAYPCGQPLPTTSNLNVVAGETRANHTVVALDGTGSVCVYSTIATHVIADLAGYFGSSGGTYRPITPLRVLDTRGGGVVQAVAVSLASVVPADATAVTVNVTVVSAVRPGFLTVYPCGQAVPLASNINFRTGQTVPNLVTVKLGAGQKICTYSDAPAHVLIDLAGSYGSNGTTLTSAVPDRFLDTRNGTGGWLGMVGVNQKVKLDVGGSFGVPAGATAAVLNVTVTGTQSAGFLVAYPCDAPMPNASNLNFVRGDTVPNLVVVRLDASGSVCFTASTRAYVLADLAGWFTT